MVSAATGASVESERLAGTNSTVEPSRYDHVYVHQIGPEQDGFFDFYEREVLPSFS